MDAARDGKPITPRWGKCVEVNALWYKALKILASRSKETTQGMRYSRLAEKVARSFPVMFWNESTGCLYDCVNERGKDASIRPNQIIVLALADSLLSPLQRESVIETVKEELLTPYGLRTLSPKDPAYKPRYEGDDTYHQGTVWPWLMGFFIEAYLKVHNFSPNALQQADDWLKAFDEHLSQAGIGFISEIFDGEPPYKPAGCIAQAWSVGEILRAKRLLQRYKNKINK
ncbi:MAG: glycogen debranching protein, partial [Planctomycetes bacterium]|nr:glycogen debranching protein [Planctomycetota bacterium]